MTKSILQNATRLFTLMVFTVPVLMGCKEAANKYTKPVSLGVSQVAEKQSVSWPEPTSYIGEIPVYEKFDRLEPIFNFKNDTTYIINFWATWCKPCIEELPYFEAFNAANKDKKVKVILCSLDFPKKLETQLVPFVRKKELESTVVVLLDGKYNDWIDKVSSEWSGAIPATYIYNKDQSHFIGEPISGVKQLEEAIEPFL